MPGGWWKELPGAWESPSKANPQITSFPKCTTPLTTSEFSAMSVVAKTKRMRAAQAVLPKTEAPLPLAEAIGVLQKFPATKFDQSVEIHMRLGIDPKQADLIIRGSLVLPHGIGKSKRVVVFAKGNLAEDARQAGAEEVGADDLAKKIKEGWTDFDVCIAAPRHDGARWPTRKSAWPSWPDAQPSGRHGDV